MRRFVCWYGIFWVLGFWTLPAKSDTIYLKDGRSIQADKIWEEHLGTMIDDVALYAYTKAGMSSGLIDALRPFKDRPMDKAMLLKNIEQSIGKANTEKFQNVIVRYLSNKVIVAYEKYGNVVKINKSEVKSLKIDKPTSLPSDLIDPGDIEAQNAVIHERELLYKRLRNIKKNKAAYQVGSPTRGYYREEEREVLELINELDDDPLGYFLRHQPFKVNLKEKLSAEECATICGRELSSVETTVIRDASEEETRFDHCMWSCTGKKKWNY